MEGRGSGERRTPRRLFSLDSMKSRRSSSETSEGEKPTKKRGKGHTKLLTLDQVDEHVNDSILSLNNISESPRSITPKPSFSSLTSSAAASRLALPALATNVTVRSMTPENQPPSSPSTARWNSIRQHVMPTPRSTGHHTQQSSSNSLSSFNTQQPRHGHPKSSSSKFAQKLGFRNVVDHARQVRVDETQHFASEIQRACMAARYIDPQAVSKYNASQTPMSSALYLPFVSSASLAAAAAAPGNSGQTTKKGSDLRRPQSTYSLGASARALGSVKPLHHTLLNYAGPFADGSQPLPQLPVEPLVMSTLLSPFLTVDKVPGLEEERWTAMEAFEVIVRTWNPADEIIAVERSLWCVQAALCSSPPLRTRTLSALWSLTVSPETHYPATTPRTLQTLLHGLFLLLPAAREQVGHDADTEDSRLLSEIVSHVYAGSGGDLDDLAIEEEYNALFVDGDSSQTIRDAVTVEALARCLEYSTEETKRWLLTNSLENLWSLSPRDLTFTPLQTAIHSRILASFTRAALGLLSSSLSSSSETKSDLRRYNDGVLIVRALQSRVFPSIEAITNVGATEDPRKNSVEIVLEVVALEGPVHTGTGGGELIGWAVEMVCTWLKGRKPEWKASFEKAVKHLVETSPWARVIKVLTPLIRLLPRDVQKPAVTLLIPLLNERLVNDPPPSTFSSSLETLLTTLSHQFPQQFYKPLFLLAASSKEYAAVNHLRVLTALERVMPGFLMRDAEMVAVAIMSDGGTQEKENTKEGWGKARLGQLVLLVELIVRVQDMRRIREGSGLSNNVSDTLFVHTAKFSVELEARLAILIDAKERTSLVPPSQRLLFAVLFREIRLLTRSLKNATWVPKFVSWFVSYHETENEQLNETFDLEVMDAVSQLQSLYASASDGTRPSHKLRNTLVLSPLLDQSFSQSSESVNGTAASAIFTQRTPLLEGLAKGFEARVLKLLVAMSAITQVEDWKRIGTLLWEKHLEEKDPAILSSVCFLVMQCAEKAPMDLSACIQVDLQSASDSKRLSAIHKLSTLLDWRFQIMSQHVVADRAHRPFKVTRGPLPFVATDMGTGLFVLEPDPNEVKDKLPLELRKKLAEIGWDSGDMPVNQQLEWIRTPMTLLPVLQMDKLDTNESSALASPHIASPMSSPQKSSPTLGSEKAEELALLRRNSSSGGPSAGLKRRAVFVPALTRILPDVAKLVFDSNFTVAYAARNMVIDLMRNDPGLLTRPVWDLLGGDEHELTSAVTSLRAFLHVRKALPPAVAHNLLNYLAGFLKYMARQTDEENSFHKYARIVPIIGKLVTQVGNMSIREMKRAKLDMFFIPSGVLWFPSSAPPGPMFPRRADTLDNPFMSINRGDFPDQIVSMIMIRISQNMLFLSMLKRNPADVQVVRKSMAKLVLPSWDAATEGLPLELKDFVPVKQTFAKKASMADIKLRGLSLLLSRSYVLLVAQVFRCISRHLNDRNELAILIDGLNRILLVHGSDIGIVAQVLIALMVASTRFRRLFASGGGYVLFMPALFKVYVESEAHSGIRTAIEYATSRFYAHHLETFVFQSLDTITHVLLLPGVDGTWVGRNVYTLFASLCRVVSPYGRDADGPDVAGIYDANKHQEREALMILTAEEKPQTFLAFVKQGGGGQGQNGKVDVTVDLPKEYEKQQLSIDDFVRLLLTVIAHDLAIARAERFLRLLRYVAPPLYDASHSARTVLQEGIDALGAILSRPVPRTKASEASRSDDGHSGQDIKSHIEKQMADSKTPSNMTEMRVLYLWLVASFCQVGGRLSPEASRTAFDLVKTVLRDPSFTAQDSMASFLGVFAKASLFREERRSLKAVVYFLRDLAPVISAYALTVNFSEVFDIIRQLVRDPVYSRDPMFCHLVVTQICAAGLNACNLAGSEKLLESLPCRRALVSLLADAMCLREADILTELHLHNQHYDFLAYVVFPLALSMKTVSELDIDGAGLDPSHRSIRTRAWVRLLHYAMSCCHKSHDTQDGSPTRERNRSRDRSSGTGYKSHLPSLLIALQVIKVIVIRAEKDLTSSFPDVWSRLGVFLKTILTEGGGEFAMRAQEYSPSASPTPSPRASGQFDLSIPAPLSLNLGPRSYISPRIVDYCLWSISELICVHRTPLFIQLRAFMHDKVRALDQELRYQQNLFAVPGSRSRRTSSSVFSKRRRRVSDAVSPEASPHLSPLPARDISPNLLGYQNIPPLSSREASPIGPGPRIVHLGLVSSSALQRSASPVGGSVRFMAKTTKVKSLVLIRKTYTRIRVVQCCMGYESCLLPLPKSSIDCDTDAAQLDETPNTLAWTRRQALLEVTNETRELIEEFEEALSELDGAPVIVDSATDL